MSYWAAYLQLTLATIREKKGFGIEQEEGAWCLGCNKG